MPTTKKKLSRRNLSVDKSKTRIKFTELVTPGEDPKGLFELKDRLGTGSYGEVFQALHTKSGETFAIKIITMDDDKVLEETVRREIEVLAETSHRNIVSYFGSYLVDESLWVNLFISMFLKEIFQRLLWNFVMAVQLLVCVKSWKRIFKKMK